MTMATTCIGFVPIMLATGTGSDVWKRIAAPMIGGILTSFLLELIVYPADLRDLEVARGGEAGDRGVGRRRVGNNRLTRGRWRCDDW